MCINLAIADFNGESSDPMQPLDISLAILPSERHACVASLLELAPSAPVLHTSPPRTALTGHACLGALWP